MSNGVNSAETQQISEVSVVTSPGARTSAWAVKVKSLSSCNVYNVCAVEVGAPGSLPVEIGGQMQAVNLAESFLDAGQLPAGTFVVISRVGGKNVFYAKP
jgi:hypothetical protein